MECELTSPFSLASFLCTFHPKTSTPERLEISKERDGNEIYEDDGVWGFDFDFDGISYESSFLFMFLFTV